MERLQKVLARAGLGSRRACEDLIRRGRIAINGKTVTELGTRVDPERSAIRIDGEPVRPQSLVYYLLYKPRGTVCSNLSQFGEKRVIDLVPGAKERLYTVGRLDWDSEGLLVLTNDGELCQLLAHPRHGVTKTYRVELEGELRGNALERVQKGVWLSEGKSARARVRILFRSRQTTAIEFTIAEGKNREVRRIFARVGYPVKRLVRVKIGRMGLGKLRPGEFVRTTRQDILRWTRPSDLSLDPQPPNLKFQRSPKSRLPSG